MSALPLRSLSKLLTVLALLTHAVCTSQIVLADDKATPDAIALADEETTSDENASNDDAAPEESNEELLKHIEDLRSKRPLGETLTERREGIKQIQSEIVATANKILSNKPNEEARAAAIEQKLLALSRLIQLDDEAAEQEFEDFAKSLKDTDGELVKQAQVLLIQLRARRIMQGDVDGAPELLEEVLAMVKESPNDLRSVRLGLSVAQSIELSDKADELAIEAYQKLSDALEASSNADVLQLKEKFAAVVRRLNLVGNPIEVSGTQLDGEAFDPAPFKGKVVLVDYWATWCGPCLRELPNLLKAYQQYHKKGFEVVGVSLDDDKTALDVFIKEQEIPWTILFEGKPGETGFSHPMALKYGVMSIPTAILVGPDGKVVSLRARGEELHEQLLSLLGPADEDEDKSEESKPDDGAKPSSTGQ